MMRILIALAPSILAAAPPMIPAWLAPYPGASPQTRESPVLLESSYSVSAPVHEVTAYYRNLFDSAGLAFEKSTFGYGLTISAAPPECDLSISIRRRDAGSEVRVTCAMKMPGTERIREQRATAEAERQSRGDPMKRFDNPVYSEQTAPVWPSWLVRVDGAALEYRKAAGRLVSTFASQPTREAIAAFYSALLTAHGYRMSGGGSWLVATARPDLDLGRNTTIWVKVKPAGSLLTVELSVH
jgi:hypothetical protein